MSVRVCKVCKIEKNLELFSKYKRINKYNYTYTCKKCTSEKQVKKYWENPEKFKKRAKQYRDNAPEEAREKWRIWHKNERRNNPIRLLLRRARRRARELSLPYNLMESDITIPDNCPILGIELKVGCAENNLPTDNSISLDRVDNNLGYIKGNVIVISMRANRIKNNSNFEEIEKLYNFLKNLRENK
jgi:hypothetical protein